MIGFPLTDGAVPGPRRESERMRPNPSIPGPGQNLKAKTPGLTKWKGLDLRAAAVSAIGLAAACPPWQQSLIAAAIESEQRLFLNMPRQHNRSAALENLCQEAKP